MVKEKRSILMMPAACGLGHAMRCVCLGRALQEKGHNIAFAASKKILDVIRSYKFKHLYETKDESWRATSLTEIGEIVTERSHVQQALNDELQIIERVKPSLIINDFRLTPRFSAHLKNIPWAALASHAFYFTKLRGILNSILIRVNLSNWVEEFSQVSSRLARKVVWLFKETGLPPIEDWPEITLSPFCTLIASIPELEGTSHLPEHAHFVGPLSMNLCEQKKAIEESEIKKRLEKFEIDISLDDKIVYVCLSSPVGDTAFNNYNQQVLSYVQSAFKEAEYKVIIVDKDTDKSASKNNIFITPYLPNELIYRLKHLVAITNGTQMKNMEMAFNIIPMLNLPVSSENLLNALMLSDRGACRVIFGKQLSGTIIKREIRELFSDLSYRVALKNIRHSLKEYVNPGMAIAHLKQYNLI
jgi:UDP:flavonoid glycosyltransferase YjiC (YdhE family)